MLGKPQNLVAKRGQIVQAGITRGQKGRPLYGVEGWPRNRGLLCTTLRAFQSGPRCVRYRGSGRLSRVVIKRGSTIINLGMYESDEMVTCYIDIDDNDGNLFHSS